MITLLTDIFKKIDYTPDNGLVFCDNPKWEHIAEWLHITERAKKLGAKAVLFRRYFNEGEEKPYNSKPSVYIFEEEDSFFNSEENKLLHAKIWSAGEIDVYMIIGKTQIDIINARRPAKLENNDLDLENLKLYSKTLEEFNDQRFSAHIFGKGMFWEQGDFYDESKDENFFKNKLEEENTPYHQLFAYLKQTRKYLFDAKQLATNVIDKLLIICILIKFLEEIKEEKDGIVLHTLSEIYKENDIQNFAESLFQNKDNGKTVAILEALGTKLNGKIFDYFTEQEENETEQDFIKRNTEIKDSLRKQDFSPIANFLLVRLNKETGELDFDLSSKQIKIDFEFKWSQYSFRHLPIELISSIYEHFLQEDAKQLTGKSEKGVVYTPPFLVNFLIDEVMPLDKSDILQNNSFKILDPSCGSGIFLVAAYKRLLQWWIINYYNEHKEIPEKFDAQIFQNLLENNIYGVDVASKATLISLFSVTIAFLDKLTPIAFWNNLNFKKLRENIKTQNFFEWASTAPKDFDLVIGNPPFNVATEYKKRVKEYHKKFITPFQQEMGFKYSAPIPDNLAFYFLEFAKQLSPQKKVCLIIPTTLLLYSSQNTSLNYRKALFENSNVEKIYDFTHLRRILFKRSNNSSNTNSKKQTDKDSDDKNGAEIPVCAIILNNSEPQFNKIEHTVIKRIVSTEKKMRFEIDHYDRHFVRFDWACTYPFVWKCNLLGGGRLFHLIYRLSLLQNLEDFIENKKKENNWIYSNGYIGQYGDEANNKKADFLNGNPHIKPRTFDEFGNFIKEDIPENKYFWNTRVQKLYEPPHIVFKLVVEDKKIPMAWVDEYLCFNSSFVGIAAPEIDKEDLYKIYKRLHKDENLSNLYRAFILATSSKALVYHETSIIKEDIDNLPFPNFTDEEEEYLELTKTEEILRDDVLKHYKHLGKSVKIGDDGYEPLEMKLNVNDSEDEKILHGFGDVFCKNLNEIYEKNGNSWQRGKIYQTKSEDKISEGFIIYQFGFGTTTSEIETIKVDETYLKKLIFDEESNRGAIWVRVGRIYQHTENGYDCVFLIKPANIRYWLRSVALRDADKTFMDLKKAGF